MRVQHGDTQIDTLLGEKRGNHLKRALQIVGLASALALLTSLAAAQETHISREGGAWGQEVTGSLSGVKVLRVKVDMGSVMVRGGQQQEINYVVHTNFEILRNKTPGASLINTK